MIGLLKLILCICVYIIILNTAECQVTVTNINGTFLCGHSTRLECAIPGYGGGMTWKLDGTIVAQCAFSSCSALGALPSGDNFTYDESAGIFYLDIGITHADNGTTYQCDDGSNQGQTTVNIQVPPSESAFTITETAESITVEAGCFYPSNAGRMNVYCVNSEDTELRIDTIDTITLTPTTTGCSGDCAGPNIYTATGNITIDSSNSGGNLKYRFKVYHKDASQTQYVISKDSTAIYNCVPAETCECECECRIPCLVVKIIFALGTLILVGVFYPLDKGPSSDKIRCYVAGIAVVTCVGVVIGMTACLFAGCEECKCECCTKPCPIAGTVVGWLLFGCAAGCYIFYLVKSKPLGGLCCGVCQVKPSCENETKSARKAQHQHQPGKDKFAANTNNGKGRENAGRTNSGPRPQPAPPTKEASETSDSEVSRKDVTLEHGVRKRVENLFKASTRN